MWKPKGKKLSHFGIFLDPVPIPVVLHLNLSSFMQRPYSIALVGNPNSGKSSLFNALTGLNQKVGNFPGVTVDKKTGTAKISDNLTANIIDLPGTYSLYPKSADEQVTYEVLLNKASEDRPDLIIVIADASNLKRNLLFCTQITDLHIPVIVVLTMMDIAAEKGIEIDVARLGELMGAPVLPVNPRKNKGIAQLKKTIADFHVAPPGASDDFVAITSLSQADLDAIKLLSTPASNYGAIHIACNYPALQFISENNKGEIAKVLQQAGFQKSRMQANEIMERYLSLIHI